MALCAVEGCGGKSGEHVAFCYNHRHLEYFGYVPPSVLREKALIEILQKLTAVLERLEKAK